MDKRSIRRFQQLLTQHSDEIQARVNAAKAHIRDQHHHQAKDEGDRATASVSADMTVVQQAQAEHTLAAIRAALLRIEQGTFGECVQCSQEIGIKRLDAIPWTRYCIVCQELLDSR